MNSGTARRLEGKVAVVTGGASGIGESTARLLHRHGAKVIIADIQDQLGLAVAADLGPSDCSFVHCDVTDESQVRDAVDAAVSRHGKLDIMFNNAGTADPCKPSIAETEKSDFEKVLAVNATGVFLGIKHAARVMVPAGRGSIVNAASVASVHGGVAGHAYTCSKHAVVGLTKNAAVELGPAGIRVNCVSPYLIRTPLTEGFFKPPKPGTGEDDEDDDDRGKNINVRTTRIYSNLEGVKLETEDVAEAVVYLASDESRYVTGHNPVVDGGFTIHNAGLNLYG